LSSDGADGQQEGNREPLDPPSSFVINTGDESKDVYENPNVSTTAANHASMRPLSPYQLSCMVLLFFFTAALKLILLIVDFSLCSQLVTI